MNIVSKTTKILHAGNVGSVATTLFLQATFMIALSVATVVVAAQDIKLRVEKLHREKK